MKKLTILVLFIMLLFPQTAFSSDNFIYSINVGNDIDTDRVVLNVKSDYKSKIKDRIDEQGRKYFDIKDASLKENFSVLYNNAHGVENVIAQQIGNKVRIYVNADELDKVDVIFNNVENQPYPDKSAGYALVVFMIIMFAISKAFCTKTARTAKKAQTIKNHNSKQVFRDLMDKKPQTIVSDRSKMTLNTLAKNQREVVKSQISGRNIRTLNDYQQSNFGSKIAM